MHEQGHCLQDKILFGEDKSDGRAEILIIDDTPANLELLAEILKQSGYIVRVATDGEMAIRTAKFRAPDIILLDICLPGMDGYTICQYLKDDSRLAHIPVIFISALAQSDEKVRAFACGGIDYITKPFVIQEIQARIAIHLKIEKMQRELKQQNLHLQQTIKAQLEQISKSQDTTIFALAKLVEFRDRETGTHLERTRRMCKILAKELQKNINFLGGISDDFLEYIYHSSALHDIGKAGIEDAILLKRGRLNAEEMKVVQTHSALGAQALEEVYQLYPNKPLKMAIEIAKNHHEKWDGSGYPDGLAGESIPLCARIMGIVDVYDALRSKRHYKKAMSHEKACSIILKNKGTHFDPQLVEVFLEVREQFRSVFASG